VLEARLAEYLSDGRTDDERARDLESVALECDSAVAGLRDVDTRLAAFGGDPRADFEPKTCIYWCLEMSRKTMDRLQNKTIYGVAILMIRMFDDRMFDISFK
jgi:hypothetical protein